MPVLPPEKCEIAMKRRNIFCAWVLWRTSDSRIEGQKKVPLFSIYIVVKKQTDKQTKRIFRWKMRNGTTLIHGVTYFTGIINISKLLHTDGILCFFLGLQAAGTGM